VTAVRFTFACDVRGEIRVTREQRLEKNVAVIRRLVDDFKGKCGFWIEVKDTEGRVLYRRVMHDPTTHWESAGDLMRRRRWRRRRADEATFVGGLFSIVVPTLEHGSTVVIMASRPGNAPARPILTIPLGGAAHG
jgi:hypothetical protein